MNDKIKQFAEQADIHGDSYLLYQHRLEKFAELIIAECCVALHPMLRDMISRGQGVDMIVNHFGLKDE